MEEPQPESPEKEAFVPAAHISYSALNDYMQCGKMYQLKRRLGLPERPAWWNVGGHAVHAATEAYDRQLYATVGN